jgi:chitinase
MMIKSRIRKILSFTMIATLLLSLIPVIVFGATSAWAPNTAYAVNDLVTYNSSTYSCIQAHTSQVGWEPPNTPALWALQTGSPTPTPTPAPTATPAPTSSPVINGAIYKLINQNSGKALDVTASGTTDGTNVEIWSDYNNGAQQWQVISNGDGTYKLINPNSGKALDISAAGTADGTNVQIWTDNGTVAQKWQINSNSDGTSTLINPNSGKALDVSSSGTANGTNVQIWTSNGTGAQKWNLVQTTTTTPTPTPAPTPAPTATPTPGGYKVVGYYPEWAVYGRNFKVPQINATKLTHINYAFADICWNGTHGNPDPSGPNPMTWSCQDENGVMASAPNGTIVQGDPWADTGMSYPGDVWSDPIKGSFKQLILLKQANPKLKTIISIGGWSWSNRFSDVAADPATRSNFANSAVNFLRKYSFDGVDLDWEYPVGGGLAGNSYRPADKQNYTLLLQAIRSALNTAGTADGKHYSLTIASGASPTYIQNTELSSIASIVDWINIMTYDFHGGFDPSSGNNAPLNYDPADVSPNKASYNDNAAITNYLNAGVPANKLIMGEPFYGRGWAGCANVNNGLYQPCSGAATVGTWDKGVFDFSDLEANYINKNGYTRYWNSVAQVPYLYNPSGGTFISYDDAQSIGLKDNYIKSKGLAGAMFWELSSDRNNTLINQVNADLPHQ